MARLLNVPSLAVAVSFCALAVAPHPAAALQVPGPRATPDTASMRRALAAQFGPEIEIVRHELNEGTPERGGTFWLVHARPRRSGDYHLTYRYEYRDHVHPERPLYTHIQHDSNIRVGERGCLRRRSGKDVCVGDTIILPFVVRDYRGHTFGVTRRANDSTYLRAPESAGNAGPDPAALPNPASASLRYLGAQRYIQQHRAPGSTVVYTATFEAAAPGRFNLALRSRGPDEPVPAQVSAAGSIPVVVVPRGQPVTVLLESEDVSSVDQNHGFSSHSGNQYMTTRLLLQPGDRITLEYSRFSTRGRDYRPGDAGQLDRVPVITRLPFQMDRQQRFDAWIMDQAPPASQRP